jgi:hypothetical protein
MKGRRWVLALNRKMGKALRRVVRRLLKCMNGLLMQTAKWRRRRQCCRL